MGIYIFKSKHGPYIKVGHSARKDPWNRVSSRGFYSCICPPLIMNKVSMNDLELCKWYPTLTYGDEKCFHFKMKIYQECGEWYNVKYLDNFITYLDELQNIKTFEEENRLRDENFYVASIYFKVPYKNKNILLESLPNDTFLTEIGGYKTIFEEKSKEENIPEIKNISSSLRFPENQGKIWSKDDKRKLIDFVFKNTDITEITKKLGRSKYSIHCQIRDIIIKEIEKTNLETTQKRFDSTKYTILNNIWEDIQSNYEIQNE